VDFEIAVGGYRDQIERETVLAALVDTTRVPTMLLARADEVIE
jgi:hypothetical protein